jgi:DNA modification methylase
MKDFVNKIITCDAMSVLKTMSDKSVHCCITSPPYWGKAVKILDKQLCHKKKHSRRQ